MAAEFYDGKRLSFDGQLCTVRYFGEVKGTKGEWLGVEWDDPSRGKHSGENGGIRYFECVSKIPTAASFVRPTRKSDHPRTFVEALKHKYASESFEDPDVKVVYIGRRQGPGALAQQSRPIRINGKEAEEVGFDKIRKKLANLYELRIVLLDGLCTSRSTVRLHEDAASSTRWSDGLADIKDTCPKIIELDLSRNLFEEWREIASICEQLDRLRTLRIDGNRFRDTTLTEDERSRCSSVFSNIESLKLENTLLTWQAMTYLAALFPSLTSFVASSNEYTSLSNYFLPQTITDLTLEENNFHTFSDISPLTRLPDLQRLVLKSNKISSVHGSSSKEEHPVFSPSLSELDLSYNEISTWSCIDTLSTTFPGLSSLRISHNPLYQTLRTPDRKSLSPEDGYMLTIARIGQLKVLNYSPITPKERLNSESYYLSLIVQELTLSPPESAPTILASHPRYSYLCAEYGEPTINRSTSSINPNSLAARLVKFTFYLGASGKQRLGIDYEDWDLEAPMSLTVYTLLGLVGKHYDMPPLSLRLVWETGDWMTVSRDEVLEDETWDSASEDEGVDGDENQQEEQVMREVEIVAGTRLIGTWVDGREVIVRVEVR